MPATRNVPKQVARARSSLGRKIQLDAAPEVIEAARADLAAANAKAVVRRVADQFPPLPAETRAELAVIMLGGKSDAA